MWRAPLSRLSRVSLILIALFGATAGARAQEEGVIRLGNRSVEPSADAGAQAVETGAEEARRGFDYERFESRLGALWFQRKAFLADGADDKAAEQANLIKAFCREEGVRSLTAMAGALIAETQRHLEVGHYNRALEALNLAEVVDPGRAQIRFARAAVYWQADGRNGQAALEWLGGVGSALTGSIRDLSFFRRIALTLVVALTGTVILFAFVMLFRYQLPFRHEVEEFTLRFADERLARPAGWILLLLPIFVWFLIGWAALYWLAITFRFMRRSERLATVVLLLSCVAALPLYRSAVAVYGLTADPVVRTTLAAADGEYDPDRIVQLRQLVNAHPDNGSYRFLLAGLYKNGRFFEEAFEAYKQTIEIDPSLEQAYINIGNIFSITGQYGEAIVHYQKAIEIAPQSVLAHFNMHLAQSESFRFREAKATLAQARQIDTEQVANFMGASAADERSTVIDAQLEIRSVWGAALGGHTGAGISSASVFSGLANPVGIGSAAVMFACFVFWVVTRGTDPARRCIRCGDPFCDHCKSPAEGREYCMQCLHLYVLGDGLAPETKTRKLFEVEQHERRSRMVKRLISFLLPGTAQLARGRALAGIVLLTAWLTAWFGAIPALLRGLDRIAGVGLRLDLLESGAVPTAWSISALSLLCGVTGVLVWMLGNGWSLRRRGI